MEQFTKIDETTVQETIQQPDMVVNTTLDSLIEQKNILSSEIGRNKILLESIKLEFDAIENKIVSFKELGVKTAQEVEEAKTLGVLK